MAIFEHLERETGKNECDSVSGNHKYAEIVKKRTCGRGRCKELFDRAWCKGQSTSFHFADRIIPDAT